MTQTISTLSRKRIVISLILTAMIPITARILNIFLDQEQISLMFSMNIFTSVLIMYNWNLVAIHYNRAKENIPDTILYTLIGGALIFLWSLLGLSFFQAHLILPPAYALIGYGYARPGFLVAFSFMESAMLNLTFKIMTDHLDVIHKELQSILLSALAVGLVITIAFVPLNDISLLLRSYVYFMGLFALLSYLYNQTHTIVPGILALGIVNLILMILSMTN
ncbi:MAG: hypothetical protein IKG53_03485 [Solobacterium sp.]|nr:hypothetical protein [Solobacterium sp.]